MSTFQEFPSLVVASCLTGIALTTMKGFGEVHAVAAQLLGDDIYTHELAYEPLMEKVTAEGYWQFPLMPTRAEAEADWEAAAAKVTKTYGATVIVRKGTGGRREDPVTTLYNMIATRLE